VISREFNYIDNICIKRTGKYIIHGADSDSI
jgi:hypothetical protein